MDVLIEYKKIKYNRIRIDSTGRVILSVRLNTTKKEIEELLQKYDSWIKKNMIKAIDDTLIYSLTEGSTIYILGDIYLIRIIIDSKEYVQINGGFIDIHTKENTESKINKIFDTYLNNLRQEVYKDSLDKYLNLTGLSIKEFKIRKMKRTLGKCYYEKKSITLSTTLIHKPIDYIEAICLHEIAHLLYPNHQRNFYSFIYKYMPDYKIRLKHLKNN